MSAAPSPPPAMALMRLIIEAATLEEARAQAVAQFDGEARAAALARLTPAAFARVKGVLATVDHQAQTTPEVIAAAFDRAAAVSPEGGVALYSLGDPGLLAEITEEVVAWMEVEGLLGPEARVAEVGCGIGRYLQALAPRTALAIGLDVSPRMTAEAGRRCAGLTNVLGARSSGRDLACLADASLELLLFADSFPYLVQAGEGLPERHFAEAARVLRPGGRLLILNFSYRGDPARDQDDAQALAGRAGLRPLPAPERPFRGWDGRPFLFEKP